MKKLMLVAMVVLGTAAITFAQIGPSASDNLTVGTDIVAALTCAKINDLNLGTIVQGQNRTVSPTSSLPNTQVGEFKVTGTPSINVIFTFQPPANLSDGATPTPDVIAFSNSTPVWNTSELNTSGTTAFGSSNGGTIPLPGGTVYIYVGGSVTAGANQAVGHYTGVYTLTVQYQ